MSARPCLEGSLPTPQRPAIFHPVCHVSQGQVQAACPGLCALLFPPWHWWEGGAGLIQ